MKRLLAVALLVLIPALALAGSTEDWSLPHIEHITLYQQSFNSTYPAGHDSASFYLEGTTASLAAVYDTISMKDTLSAIPLQPGVTAQNMWTVGATGDSIWAGRLKLRFGTALAATDTVFIAVDALMNGQWISQATSSNAGWLRAGANQGGAQCVTRDVWINNYRSGFAAATNTTNAAYSYWGAKAIRCRLQIGKSSAVKLVSSATWMQFSNSPSRGEIY